MPSAGDGAFSEALITRLVARGVQFAPLALDTGVSSLDDDEAPYPERYAVPSAHRRALSTALCFGFSSRVIAVGTTCVRALETVTDAPGGTDHAGEGYVDLADCTPPHAVRIYGCRRGFTHHAPAISRC